MQFNNRGAKIAAVEDSLAMNCTQRTRRKPQNTIQEFIKTINKKRQTKNGFLSHVKKLPRTYSRFHCQCNLWYKLYRGKKSNAGIY